MTRQKDKNIRNVAANKMGGVILCSDNTIYTGWTNDLEGRISVHNAGNGAKYTKARLPVKLVYSEVLSTKSDALKREHEIKN